MDMYILEVKNPANMHLWIILTANYIRILNNKNVLIKDHGPVENHSPPPPHPWREYKSYKVVYKLDPGIFLPKGKKKGHKVKLPEKNLEISES